MVTSRWTANYELHVAAVDYANRATHRKRTATFFVSTHSNRFYSKKQCGKIPKAQPALLLGDLL